MWKVLLLAACAISLIAVSRGCSAQAASYQVPLTDQQIDNILAAASQCENRAPFACADLVIYLRNLMAETRKPKEPKKE